MVKKQGIDVSRYQGDVDWSRVKEDGVEFAILRVGYSNYRGGVTLDSRFRRNMEGAAKSGIPAGVYVYAYDESAAAAASTAERVLELVRDYRVEYPVVYDFEDGQYRGRSRAANTAVVKAFLDAVRAGGYYPMLYSYAAFFKSYLEMERLAGADLWVADYRGSLDCGGEAGIWQYSAKGRVSGISGDVDLDAAFRDYPALIREAGLNGLAPAPGKWMLDIYSFREEERAREVAAAFRTIGLYSEVRPLGSAWRVLMFSFAVRSRAEEISRAVRALGFYNEVKPVDF